MIIITIVVVTILQRWLVVDVPVYREVWECPLNRRHVAHYFFLYEDFIVNLHAAVVEGNDKVTLKSAVMRLTIRFHL